MCLIVFNFVPRCLFPFWVLLVYKNKLDINIYHFSTSAPSIRIANESSSILYGVNITLHCLIVAHPAITTFSWGINTSTGFTDITSGGSYTVETDTSAGNNGQANTTLTISNVTFVEKTYTCRAGNNIGDEFVSVTLYVLGGKISLNQGRIHNLK